MEVLHPFCNFVHEAEEVPLSLYFVARIAWWGPPPRTRWYIFRWRVWAQRAHSQPWHGRNDVFCTHTNVKPRWPVFMFYTVKVIHQSTVFHIRADEEPRWIASGAAGTIERENIGVVEGFPDSYFMHEQCSGC